MHPPQFPTFTDAYRAVLQQVRTDPQFTTSTRGNRSHERLNMAFTLADPRRRSPYLAARKTNIVFNHAETLWYLAGRDDLAMIGYYAPRLRALSADGLRLTGSAYGPRLFDRAGGGPSQWDRVLSLLGRDSDSKRAVMTVMRPDELAEAENPDVACTLALQFLLREGRLHMVTSMRGNDAVIGLVCDVFAFTFVQEFTAARLGVELGTYTHQVASMHVNEPDLAKVAAITAEPGIVFPAAAMPVDTSWDTISWVLSWEADLRANRCRFTPGEAVPAGEYWRQVLLLFEVYRQIVHHPGEPVAAATLAELTPAHRWLVAHRWPERVRVGQPAAERVPGR